MSGSGNPFKAPSGAAESDLHGNVSIYRVGDHLLVPDMVELPDGCVFCNRPGDYWFEHRQRSGGWPGLLRRQWRIRYNLCRGHRFRHHLHHWILVACIAGLAAGPLLIARTWFLVIPLVLFLLVVVLIRRVVSGGEKIFPSLRIGATDRRRAHLHGCCRAYVERFPPLPE